VDTSDVDDDPGEQVAELMSDSREVAAGDLA
jgi:hypothetical protein